MFTKHPKRNKKFRERGDLNNIYNNEVDKACFANGSAYSTCKHFAKIAI